MGKKDGSLSPCIDYRGLNDITIKNNYLLPLIDPLFEPQCPAKLFTKLDIQNAYHLVHIQKVDEWKMAFNSPLGHFEFQVMPFGLSNTPAVFQAMVNDILRDMINHFVFVYLDEIWRTLEEHVEQVQLVLKRLLDNKLYVKPKKCEFHSAEISFWAL